MPSQTRVSLQTLLSLLVDDPNDRLFTAAQKQAKLQEAQERFVLDTRALRDILSPALTLVDGTQEYSLPTDVMDIERVSHKGVPLERKSKYELDFLAGGARWDETKGAPIYFYVDLDPNNQKMGFYPIPDSGAAGANTPVEYVKIPPALSSDSSVPLDGHTLLIPYHNALAYWAAKELLWIRPTQENMVKCQHYQQRYEAEVSHCIETFKHMEQSGSWRLMGGLYHKGL